MSYQEIESAVMELPVEDQLRLIDRVQKSHRVSNAEQEAYDRETLEICREREEFSRQNPETDQNWDSFYKELQARSR